MTCPACEQSKVNRWCGAFRADCKECSARSLAASPEHYWAKECGRVAGAYKDALVAVFGDDWQEGHLMVKRWSEMK